MSLTYKTTYVQSVGTVEESCTTDLHTNVRRPEFLQGISGTQDARQMVSAKLGHGGEMTRTYPEKDPGVSVPF